MFVECCILRTVYGGYLETRHDGTGTEVLYHPQDSNRVMPAMLNSMA